MTPNRIKFVSEIIAGQSPASVDVFPINNGQPFLQGKAEFGDSHPQPRYECAVATKQAVRGDVLVSVRAPVGAVNVADRDYGIGRGLAAVRADSIDPQYLRWVIENAEHWLRAEANGSTFEAITAPTLGNVRFVHGDRVTQQRIADYLDRETGEIDAMIATMDELAETLEARRIESITSAISGANSVDRIQTGNIWFPTMPRGWRTSSVQLLSDRLTDGAHISPETEHGEYDFVSTRDVRHGVIDFEGSLKTSASSYEYLVRTGCRPSDGDILFSKDGTIGETAIVVGTPEFVVASSLIIATPTRALVTPEFLRYALESGPAQRAARSFARGSGLPRISVINFGRGVVVPVPPTLEEQKSITDHLDDVTGKIDAMLTKTAELKSLLTERRAALITDVVTGRKEVA